VFLLLGEFLQVLKRLFHALQPFLRRPFPRGLLAFVAVVVRRVVLHFLLQNLHLTGRLLPAFLQRFSAAKRTAAGTGPDPHAVLGHTLQRDDLLINQRGDGVGQELVQELAVARAEIAEEVIIDPHLPANPHVSQIPLREPVDVPGTTHALNRGEHPQRQQNLGIDGVPPHAAFDSLNRFIKHRDIQPLHITPHRPHPMVPGNQLIQRRIYPTNLIANRLLDTNGGHDTLCFETKNSSREPYSAL
jgi:hypothetical protein